MESSKKPKLEDDKESTLESRNNVSSGKFISCKLYYFKILFFPLSKYRTLKKKLPIKMKPKRNPKKKLPMKM